ncbi:MAG: OmpA family protein [Comamonadaceae bacterium]|nr:OmpA family protein [Comamonadaceae bacterium]
MTASSAAAQSSLQPVPPRAETGLQPQLPAASGLQAAPRRTQLQTQPLQPADLQTAPRTMQLQPTAQAGQLQPAPAAAASALRPSQSGAAHLQRTQELLGELKAVQQGQERIVLELPSDVLFDFDKSDIRPDAQPVLDKVRELLQAYQDVRLSVHGHTDSKGSEDYNMGLSQRRANTVATALQDVLQHPIQVHAHGESQPIAPNAQPDGSDDPHGRQRNRRVQLEITQGP